LRAREVQKAEITPTVTLIVPAHDEADVIGRRVENLLELDYPREHLQIVVASDGSTDRTDEIVESPAQANSHLRLIRSERAGKLTGGNGAIYAVRREYYVEWPFGHDLGFPNLMVQRGRRAVYEPEALAFEKPSRHIEDEYRRKVRMLPWSWRHLFEARSLRDVPRLYLLELLSHRVLRYVSGFLHVALVATSIALVDEGLVYQAVLAAQIVWLVLAVAGKLRLPVPGAGLAYYYLLMTWATVVSLGRYLREGAPLMWEKAEGTR